MYTKLDKPVASTTEAALTPYDKAARLFLEYAIAGKLGSFEPKDQADQTALEAEVLAHEAKLAKDAEPKPVPVAEPPKKLEPPAKA